MYRVDDGREAFVDFGKRIDVLAKGTNDGAMIAAALKLAAEKYDGAFELTVTEEFKRRAIDIMIEYKIEARLKDAAQEALRRARAAGLARTARNLKTRQQRRK